MGGFKRLCLIFAGLASLFCLAALALPWVGPWREQATSLLYNQWYFIALEACFCVSALLAVVTLLRGLFAPRKVRTVRVSREGQDEISVTTAAITSQASYLIERDGRFAADRVQIDAKRRGKVRVKARVRPQTMLDISEAGEELRSELHEGLSLVCGNKVKSIDLQFVEASSYDPIASFSEPLEPEPAEAPVPAQDVSVETPTEIRVPVGSSARSVNYSSEIDDSLAEQGEGEE